MKYSFAFFPGQGAQAPGMGRDLYGSSSAARAVFEEASEGAGRDVAKLCFESDADELSRTENSQIAIFTHSLAALAVLRENGVSFDACAGFSLGEYTALVASGTLGLMDGIQIVSMRGKLMQHAADTIDGGMAAVLGLDDAAVEAACAKVTDGIVLPVNYNCPGQLVIAGETSALAKAVDFCKEAGARRALQLAVSGAFHTPLMQNAAEQLRDYAADFSFKVPNIPIYSNVTADVLKTDDYPKHLETHMVSPVRWKMLVSHGIECGMTSALEIGPGKTLTGFAGKIDKALSCTAVSDMASAEAASK